MFEDSSQGSANAMPIIAENAEVRQIPESPDLYEVKYHESPLCTECSEVMRGYDTRSRIWKVHGGKENHVFIRRFECSNPRCQCGVITVLPPDLMPHKRYGTAVIEDVLDEVCTPDTPPTEDYPCEKTMDRWKKRLEENKTQIDGMLRTIGSRLEEFGEDLLKAEESLLEGLRERLKEGWLTVITRYACLFRMPLPLQASGPPDLSLVFEEAPLSLIQEDKKSDEKQGSTELAGRGSTAKVPSDQSDSGSDNGSGPEDRKATADRSRQ